jgi:glutamyl-tRNA synthetase
MGCRGRLAPTPTGLLHVGHARTFARAAERAGDAGLVLRIEDLDGSRCRPEFVGAAIADLILHPGDDPDDADPIVVPGDIAPAEAAALSG